MISLYITWIFSKESFKVWTISRSWCGSDRNELSLGRCHTSFCFIKSCCCFSCCSCCCELSLGRWHTSCCMIKICYCCSCCSCCFKLSLGRWYTSFCFIKSCFCFSCCSSCCFSNNTLFSSKLDRIDNQIDVPSLLKDGQSSQMSSNAICDDCQSINRIIIMEKGG